MAKKRVPGARKKASGQRSSKPDKLAEYRRKRSADRTPEPIVGESLPRADRARMFVVQKHAARRMHYDLRLEMEGALQSWAVPRGPSLDPKEKRLAVEVEEHPLEYANFEGLIPAGNYGAGAVVVWDQGLWEPVDHDPVEGLKAGKLLFDLKGYKLRGRWTLFRTSKKGAEKQNEWLLMKKPDAWADPEAELEEASIHSGLTVEEVRDGVDPAAKLRRRIKRLKAPTGEVPARSLEVQLAQPREKAFDRKGWIFELKYDGYRLLVARDGQDVLLRYRRGHDATKAFPEVARAVEALPFSSFVIDGELVVLDDEGRPSFQGLQQRVHLSRTVDIARVTIERPATLFVFDLLAFEDFDLRGLPLLERKKLLKQMLPRAGPLRYSDHIEERGSAMYEEVRRMRLEGIIAKRADSKYRSGRTGDWLKIRADRTDDFVIVGYSAAQGNRSGFASLHLGIHDGDQLVYAGRVGSGFSDQQLDELRAQLDAERRDDPPFVGPGPEGDKHTWVNPTLVAEVRYKEVTGAGQLRQPVFLRLRDDKAVEDCVRFDEPRQAIEPSDPQPTAHKSETERVVSFTNLTKVFWPEEGYTKGDLIEYYRRISDWIMPYLEDRPLVMTRYPDGIHGKSFFQKDAPAYTPGWVRTERMWSEYAQREIHYFICDAPETLLYLANLGTIPLHLWSSRISALQHPDWCILDLDPKEAPFTDVIRVARAIHDLCDEIGLECFVKTSGSTGLHVLLPLGGLCTYEQSRTLGQLLARVIASEHRDIATVDRAMSRRKGRVYIDWVQNGHGRLLVSPFCVRPKPAAPVSTPLKWTEVRRGLTIERHTIRTVPTRMKRLESDPMRPVLEIVPDLGNVLERLAAML